MSVPVVMRGKEGEEASWWGSGKVGGGGGPGTTLGSSHFSC